MPREISNETVLLAICDAEEIYMLNIALTKIAAIPEPQVIQVRTKTELDRHLSPDNTPDMVLNSPSVIILDTEMFQSQYPDPTIDFINRLRQNGHPLKDVPLIVLSGWSTGQLQHFIQARPDLQVQLFNKPYYPDDLLNAIKNPPTHV